MDQWLIGNIIALCKLDLKNHWVRGKQLPYGVGIYCLFVQHSYHLLWSWD